MTPTDTTTDDVEQISFGPATVEDAFVNFNIRYSNPGEIIIILSDPIPNERFLPVEDEPVEASTWLAESPNGLFRQYQDHPAHPPADESPKTATVPVEHASGAQEDRVISYSHVTKKEQNKREPASCTSLQHEANYLHSTPVRVETYYEIAQRYINGPLGSDCVSHWANTNTNARPIERYCEEKYEPYVDCEVELVYDGIYTWIVKRREDVEDDDVVYEPGETYWAVIRVYDDMANSVSTIFEKREQAIEYADQIDRHYEIESVEPGR